MADRCGNSVSQRATAKIAGQHTLTDAEKLRLNAVLDYIDAVTAIDTSTAPDINWPVPPLA
ncbi:tail fiber assembly protein [Citrobacter youngae]|uniref:tail fiber assembly protein n=1 Tax=Citrobacter youngae TaxID=133448 RepID=UPI0009E3DD05